MKLGRCNLDVDREFWTQGNRWWCRGDGWWMSSGWDQVVTHQPTITQYYNIAQPTITQCTTNQPTTTQQCRHRTKQEPPNTMYACTAIYILGDVSLDDVQPPSKTFRSFWSSCNGHPALLVLCQCQLLPLNISDLCQSHPCSSWAQQRGQVGSGRVAGGPFSVLNLQPNCSRPNLWIFGSDLMRCKYSHCWSVSLN